MAESPRLVFFALNQPVVPVVAWLTGMGTRRLLPVAILIAFACNALLLGVCSAVIVRLVGREQRRTIVQESRAGEIDRLEFKSTARRNLRTDQKDDRMELVVAKTVAAFANSGGGTCCWASTTRAGCSAWRRTSQHSNNQTPIASNSGCPICSSRVWVPTQLRLRRSTSKSSLTVLSYAAWLPRLHRARFI